MIHHRLALLAACIAVIFVARAQMALAQETQTEEMERREKVLATAPAGAAKVLFGRQRDAAPMSARSIGGFARGCLAGASALPVDGSNWQVMRLARNRNWGHPELITLLERLAKQGPSIGWSGLLVGDMSQPRGGPMLTGHASHQIGLDADVWLTPMPDRTLTHREREDMSATSMLKSWDAVDPTIWTEKHA